MPIITIAGQRKPSPECEKFVKGFEGCKLKAYLPTADDVPTIGWGSTGPDIRLGMLWTQAQADARFSSDLAKFADGVDRLIGSVETTQRQFDAMASLAYNIGLGDFAKSTLLRLHKDGCPNAAEGQFVRWNKQAGKVLKGLTRRREAEAAMYHG